MRENISNQVEIFRKDVEKLDKKLISTDSNILSLTTELTSYERILEKKLYAEQKHEF